jgi:hypothetical protein
MQSPVVWLTCSSRGQVERSLTGCTQEQVHGVNMCIGATHAQTDISNQYLDDILQLGGVLSPLETCLSECIDAYKAASSDLDNLCADLEPFVGAHGSRRDLEIRFRRLGLLKGRIHSLEARCAAISRINQARLDLTSYAVNRQQHLLANEGKRFSWIMILFISPVALTTGIFSMQHNFLPLVKPNLGWFVALIAIFGSLSLAVHRAHSMLTHRWALPISAKACFGLPVLGGRNLNSRPWLRRQLGDLESGIDPPGISTDQRANKPGQIHSVRA